MKNKSFKNGKKMKMKKKKVKRKSIRLKTKNGNLMKHQVENLYG